MQNLEEIHKKYAFSADTVFGYSEKDIKILNTILWHALLNLNAAGDLDTEYYDSNIKHTIERILDNYK